MARWGAAVPPVAVLAGLEVLLLQVRRAVHRHDPADRLPPPAAAPTSRLQAPSHPAAIEQPDCTAYLQPHARGGASPHWDKPPAAASGPAGSVHPAGWRAASQFAEAVARQKARQFYNQQTAAGQRVTGAALGRAIGRSERYGRLLLAEFRAAEQEPSPNGDRRPLTGDSPTT